MSKTGKSIEGEVMVARGWGGGGAKPKNWYLRSEKVNRLKPHRDNGVLKDFGQPTTRNVYLTPFWKVPEPHHVRWLPSPTSND